EEEENSKENKPPKPSKTKPSESPASSGDVEMTDAPAAMALQKRAVEDYVEEESGSSESESDSDSDGGSSKKRGLPERKKAAVAKRASFGFRLR
ncbi:hypothetical protein RUND412_011539, partial [Rhizina undulata]